MYLLIVRIDRAERLPGLRHSGCGRVHRPRAAQRDVDWLDEMAWANWGTGYDISNSPDYFCRRNSIHSVIIVVALIAYS